MSVNELKPMNLESLAMNSDVVLVVFIELNVYALVEIVEQLVIIDLSCVLLGFSHMVVFERNVSKQGFSFIAESKLT